MNVDFSLFKGLVTEVMFFKEDWDVDEWNDQYINFKECIVHWSDNYLELKTVKSVVQEWAKDFYQDASKETHTYWVYK